MTPRDPKHPGPAGRSASSKVLRTYDAFISYAHDDHQAGVVSELHRRLERFAKPWWTARDMQVYRDRTAMGAAPDLWDTIVDAMTVSGWMIVIASPGANRSSWVNREIEWWLAHKPDRPPILALVDGNLAWSARDGGWDLAKSDALPPALTHNYSGEPFWVDLRNEKGRGSDLDDAVASIAAAIRNIPKDRMVGRHIQQQRRTRRHVGIASTVGVVLLVAALIATVLLNRQTQATTASLLAAASANHLPTDLGLAQLLAVEAYRLQPDAQTTAALFRAVTTTPQITGFYPAGGQITAIAAAGAAPVIVAGTDNKGEVVRWLGAERQVIATINEPATSVGVSEDGNVVSIVSKSGAMLWNAGRLSRVDLPVGYQPGPSAVSPSGRTAYFHLGSTDTSDGFRGVLLTLDTATLAVRSTPSDGLFSGIYAIGEGDIALYGSGGNWERRSDDVITVAGMTQVGNHSQAEALSPSGGHFTFSNGSAEIPVWETGSGDVELQPHRTAVVPGNNRDALALSPDGTQLAVSDGGAVYLAPVSDIPQPASAATRLLGNQRVSQLRFVGAHRLVGAAGDRVVTFDLTRLQRLASIHTGIELPWPCNACSAMRLAVRQDGAVVTVVGENNTALVLDLAEPDLAPTTITSAGAIDNYTQALWTAGRLVLTVKWGFADAETEVLLPGERTLRRWTESRKDRLGFSREPNGLIYDVDTHGVVLVRDPTTGHVGSVLPGPGDLQPDETETGVPIADVDPDRGRAVFVQAGSLRLEELATGSTRTLTTGVADAAFAGPHLVVRRNDGMLEVRDADSSEVLAEYPANTAVDSRSRPAGNGSILAQTMVDNRVLLTDPMTGVEIGSLPFGPQQDGRLAAASFTPDGTRLITAAPGNEGEVQVWVVSPQEWITAACATAGRDLTTEEWALATRTAAPPNLRCNR